MHFDSDDEKTVNAHFISKQVITKNKERLTKNYITTKKQERLTKKLYNYRNKKVNMEY